MRIKHTKAALLFASAGMAALLAMPATAQPGGTGTTGTTQMQSGAGTSTPNGGNSSTNMSSQGQMNTNGPNATDRSTGNDRACDRHQMHSGTSTTDTTGMNCPTDRTPGTVPDTMNTTPSGTMDTTPDTGPTPDTDATTPPSQ
jgi:hypothetical protein